MAYSLCIPQNFNFFLKLFLISGLLIYMHISSFYVKQVSDILKRLAKGKNMFKMSNQFLHKVIYRYIVHCHTIG